MTNNRNWLGWAALVMAGLALVVALGARFGGGPWGGRVAYGSGYGHMAPAAPAAPIPPDARFEQGRGEQPPFGHAFGRGDERFGRGDESFGRGPGAMGFDRQGGFPGHRHGFGPFEMIFGLFNALTKLVALGLLAWLLLRLFQQRRAGPVAPTTPAGHDPRVE